MALTLKIVGGFSVGEIARAFLADERDRAAAGPREAAAARQRTCRSARRSRAIVAERLDSVLEAIYLMFNEGYAATAGDG